MAGKLKKGSPQAKRYMAKLRAMKGLESSGDIKDSEKFVSLRSSLVNKQKKVKLGKKRRR